MKTFTHHGYKHLQHLFAEKQENECLFSVLFNATNCRLSVRTFCRDDVPLIQHWADNPACKQFWDCNNSTEHLMDIYLSVMHSPYGLPLMLCFNNKAVCFINAYRAQHDELNNYVPANANDYGIHFLMAPVQERVRHLSVCCMQLCLRFLFSFDDAQTIYGEPDINNTKANALVLKAGFRFLQQQQFSYKTANIYTCRREHFSAQLLYTPLYTPNPLYAFDRI